MEDLRNHRFFNMAVHDPTGAKSEIHCNQVAKMDTYVHNRYRYALKLRWQRWPVSEQDVPEPLLGRPLLEYLVLDTKQILEAAAEKNAGSVDAEKLDITMSQNGTGKISRVREGVYHTDEYGCYGDEEDTTTDCCDLGSEMDK